MKKVLLVAILILALMVSSVSLVAAQDTSDDDTFIVVTTSEGSIDSAVVQEIEATGAEVVETLDEVGAVVVTMDNPEVLEAIVGVEGVIPRFFHRNVEPISPIAQSLAPNVVNPPFTLDDDFYFDLQWGHDAVDAPEAWAQGFRGNGVTVAVLDEGFAYDALVPGSPFTHPDLAPNVIGSYNAIPYDATGVAGAPDGCDTTIDPTCVDVLYTLNDAFSHGTHTSGTVAAADNGYGTIGVAPEANLLLVKVLSEQLGFGQTDWIVDGIIWAVDNGADIINMSLGSGPLNTLGDPVEGYTAEEIAEYVQLYNRALRYARRNGVTVIASSGNDAFDFDANPTFIHMPSDGVGALSIAATSPLGWGAAPETGGFSGFGMDLPTTYSNIGHNVDFAAPGGDLYPGLFTGWDQPCFPGFGTPCYAFDLVFSTGSADVDFCPPPDDGDLCVYTNWYWSAGTSMAAPHAAGVAALILSETPGLSPNALRSEMRRRAADYANGLDPYYGFGRVDTDYALPADFVTCDGLPATIYVDTQGHIVSPDPSQNGRLYTGTLRGTNDADVIVGTDGADLIYGRAGDDTICGGLGDDTIRGDSGQDLIFGGSGTGGADPSGNDSIRGGEGDDTVFGGDGNDDIRGENGQDNIRAGGGDDVVRGGNGDDVLNGQNGEDSIRGDNGNDTLWGEAGADNMRGGNGDDRIYGQAGDDIMYGQNGNDTIYGGFPANPTTNTGNDVIRGGSGDDVAYGGDGNDDIRGDSNNDILDGGDDIDTIAGGSGDDNLFGGNGDDNLSGNGGNDNLDGGDHVTSDTCNGNGGTDTAINCEVVTGTP